ncbi:MAG: aminoglycoside phosphotransferase family protein [Actinomycetota bacterium]|nr:aminoglycoside phosphotransferase family protein [Actinomycetota bacterium]
MTGSIRRWPRAERLDAERVAADVCAASGVGLRVGGPCPGRQVGAAYVQWSDGRRGVLTWHPGGSLAEIYAGPVTVLGVLRGSGYPAPRIELAVQLEDAVALVQELLPGSQIDHVTTELLSRALALNDVQAGVLAEHPGVPAIQLHRREDGPAFCLHEPLRRLGRRGARLEQWIREVGIEHPLGLFGDDAVHFDFHPANLLADANRVTGVVDWDGAGRGDRRLDLVTLRFGLLPPFRRPRSYRPSRRGPRRDGSGGAATGMGAHEPADDRLGDQAFRAFRGRAVAGPRGTTSSLIRTLPMGSPRSWRQ